MPQEHDIYQKIRLKPRESRRLRQGHLWVFSNEVDTKQTPLSEFEPGDSVVIEDDQGKAIGTGYVNPHSLICARLLSRDAKHPWSDSLIVHRLKVALALREALYTRPFYRLVFGESDRLPGLVIDRFDELYSVQITTAGMERKKDAILDALRKVVNPKAVLWRNDSSIRQMEGLDSYVEVAMGELPDMVMVEEGAARFAVSLAEGQKTGWFYDQADNCRDLARWVQGKRVLDVFSYIGGWGIQALLAGAQEAWLVDASSTALDAAERSAELSGVADKLAVVEGDAFAALKSLKEQGEVFDVVVVDPPAFIKKKKDFKAGVEAYRRINQLAMQLMSKDGMLISCSCSYHLPENELVTQVHQAARHVDRYAQLLHRGGQSVDHPVHPAIPETRYLKALFFRITRA